MPSGPNRPIADSGDADDRRVLPDRVEFALHFFVSAIPLLVALWFAFGDPRAYWLFETDIEADYYYNARLLYHGYPVDGTYHPGTPIYYLGYVLMLIFGDEIERTQLVLTAGRLLAATVGSVCLFISLRLLRHKVRPVTAVGAAALMLAWPPTIGYLDYWGSDAFLPGLSFLIAVLVWLALEAPRPRKLVGIGLLTGVALAVKFSVVPLAVAAVAALSARASSWRSAVRNVTAFILPMLAALALAAAPVLDHLVGVTYLRLGILVRRFDKAANFIRRNVEIEQYSVLYLNQEILLWIIVLIIIFILIIIIINYRKWIAIGHSESSARIIFSVLAMLMVLLFLGPGNVGSNWVQLRFVTPLFAGSIFIFVSFASLVKISNLNIKTQIGFIGVAIALVMMVIKLHIDRRARFVYERVDQVVQIQDALHKMRQHPGRTAYGTSSSYLVGYQSFHLWGNYRYGAERFDRELAHTFPDITYFRWRQMRLRDRVIIDGLPRSWVQQTHDRLLDMAGTDYFWDLDRPFPRGVSQVALLAMPEEVSRSFEGESRNTRVADVMASYGAQAVDTLNVAGERWLVWQLDPTDPAQRD
jgi:hypothetical protein